VCRVSSEQRAGSSALLVCPCPYLEESCAGHGEQATHVPRAGLHKKNEAVRGVEVGATWVTLAPQHTNGHQLQPSGPQCHRVATDSVQSQRSHASQERGGPPSTTHGHHGCTGLLVHATTNSELGAHRVEEVGVCASVQSTGSTQLLPRHVLVSEGSEHLQLQVL
jgi:hypothetical protein